MNRISTLAVAALCSGLPLVGLAGCEREGPMERAGEEVDEAVDETGKAVEDAGDDLKDAGDNLKDSIDNN